MPWVWGFCLFSPLTVTLSAFSFSVAKFYEDKVNYATLCYTMTFTMPPWLKKSSHYATLVTLPLSGTCLLERWNWILEMCISLTEAQYYEFFGMLGWIHYFFLHCNLSLQLEDWMTRSNVTQCCSLFSISSCFLCFRPSKWLCGTSILDWAH